MPIRRENRARYPLHWRAIVAEVRARSGDRCEWCGVANGVYRLTYRDGAERVTTDVMDLETATVVDGARAARIVLTTAHLDHVPEHCALENLAHVCQRCHNGYDAATRARGIKLRRAKPLLAGLE